MADKIIAIGDTHGTTYWELLKSLSFDKLVFVGDYFDTRRDISGLMQIKNFLHIVEFKKENPDKVILLIGNHDYHYMTGVAEQYSGWNSGYAPYITSVLEEHKDSLQVCYVNENYVFTHAGITKTWAKNNNIDLENLEDSVNSLFSVNKKAFGFTPSSFRDNYGQSKTQPPLWVRPESLMADGIDDVIQVVGHTSSEEIHIEGNLEEFVFIDCLEHGLKQYLLIENNTLTVKGIYD